MKYTRVDYAESKAVNAKPYGMQMENVPLSGYAEDIAQATGAPVEILPILEDIMRQDVFHSTLDWQTARQFRAGARKALAIYTADAEFFQANFRVRRAHFRLMVAEQNLREAQLSDADARTLVAAELACRQAQVEESAARAEFECLSAR